MDIIFSASIIASFVAGMVALFAPCCITVLLPAYLASAFREKKNMLKMTLIFFAGIATILIPIGLGAAWLAEVFRGFHAQLYIAGGLFMLALAVLSVSGKGLKMPFMDKVKTTGDVSHPKSVYTLGVLSGAATSCCAPVLAGAMTLAVLSGSFAKALVVIFAYVFGMVFPLFLAAYFYDRFKIEESRLVQGKMITFTAGERKLVVHSTNLLAAFIFLLVGTVMLVLGLSGDAFWSPEAQAHLGTNLNTWSNSALETLMTVPDIFWGGLIIGLFLLFAARAVKRGRDNNNHTS